MLAEKYGQSPESVERWDARMFNAAVLKLQADSELNRRESERIKRGKR